MKTYFLDTNVFLQCKQLKELPWNELGDKREEILLLIPRGTQKEIDGFKAQGNTRRSDRARDASKLFRQILNQNSPVALTAQVKVGFPARRELSTIPSTPGLDLSRNDDSIIQDILAYKSLYPDQEVSIVAGDTNLLQTANEYGISFHFLPDSWLLAPEPDPKDKRIRELESKVEAFTSRAPKIAINTLPSIETLEWSAIEYSPLMEDQIEELTELIQEQYPIRTEFYNEVPTSAHALLLGRHPPSKEKVENYINVDYPDWVTKVRKQFEAVHDYLTLRDSIQSVQLEVRNSGLTPAESAIIKVTISPHLRLYYPDKSFEWRLASPPEPPRWSSFLEDIGGLNSRNFFTPPPILHNIYNHPRDKNAFYWKEKPSTVSECWERECEEFRHKMESENIQIKVLPDFAKKPKEGALTCTFSAKNIPDPIKLTIPIRMDYETVDTFAAVKELIKFAD